MKHQTSHVRVIWTTEKDWWTEHLNVTCDSALAKKLSYTGQYEGNWWSLNMKHILNNSSTSMWSLLKKKKRMLLNSPCESLKSRWLLYPAENGELVYRKGKAGQSVFRIWEKRFYSENRGIKWTHIYWAYQVRLTDR